MGTITDAFICGYVRTPIGRYGGALSSVRADDLGAVPIRVLMARHDAVDWGTVDDVVYGCANQAGEDNRNVARMGERYLLSLMMETLGVEFERRNGGWSDLGGQLQDGLLDVIAFAAGVPVPAVSQLEVQTDVNIIEFTAEEQAAIMVIADETGADAELCATDLLGQAEHGYNSPAVLVTNSEKLARDTLAEIDRLLNILPTADTASKSWEDYGEVIVCDSYDEMLAVADDIASEHEGEETGIVIEGEIEITVGGDTRTLTKGDAYLFDSRQPHRFRNVSGKPCTIVSACTPPTF